MASSENFLALGNVEQFPVGINRWLVTTCRLQFTEKFISDFPQDPPGGWPWHALGFPEFSRLEDRLVEKEIQDRDAVLRMGIFFSKRKRGRIMRPRRSLPSRKGWRDPRLRPWWRPSLRCGWRGQPPAWSAGKGGCGSWGWHRASP